MNTRDHVVTAADAVLLTALEHHADRRGDPRGSASGTPRSTSATLNSVVEYEDLATGRRAYAILAHPSESDAAHGRISVLSPVGRALLGRRAGHEVEVTLPGGDTRSLMIVAVHEGSRR